MRWERYKTTVLEALRLHLQGREPSRIPAGADFYWRAFAELSAARSVGQTGPAPLSFQDIEAWARLHRWPLQPHHVTLITAMDRIFLEQARRRLARGEGVDPEAAAPVNPGLFDAVFG